MPDDSIRDDGASLVLSGRAETISELHGLANRIASELRPGDLLVLTGELGAGKTTFTRGLAAAFGVSDTVSSPTFILAREHQIPDGTKLIHLDAYRLQDPRELEDLALDFTESITVAEWGKGLIEGQFSSWLELELEAEALDLSALSAEDALAATLDVSAETPRLFRLWAEGDRWQHVSAANFS